jgi:5-methylcytosine-specific restriction endonuclease McrA
MQLTLDGLPVPVVRPGRAYDGDWDALRRFVLERDEYRCHWCHGPATTGDHVEALVDGGARLDPANVVAACIPCNSRRGADAARRRHSLGELSRDW